MIHPCAYLLLLCVIVNVHAQEPISLHPDNNHYFLWQGKPAVLISSTEHYGAVMNLDFDYVKYLDTLADAGLQLTRTFSGVYREFNTSFSISNNTMDPAYGRFISPFARSSECCYMDGGNKFDLNSWNKSYFDRLTDFVEQASRRNIIVNFNLFSLYYSEGLWEGSPLYGGNNINNVGNEGMPLVFNMTDKNLTAIQISFVTKIVTELNMFDNLYYEIINEPYWGVVTPEWQALIAQTIAETEQFLPNKHLVAQNIANGESLVQNPDPLVSIFNFHYSTPDNVWLNYNMAKPIADDETGFNGPQDLPYRVQGWRFVLGGGAVYDNLDYSFTVGHEDGSFVPPSNGAGGGSPALRTQLSILSRFINAFDFIKMAPDNTTLQSSSANTSVVVLSEPGKQYAIYVNGSSQVDLNLTLLSGNYKTVWIDTKSGDAIDSQSISGGNVVLSSSAYEEDIALAITKREF